MTASKRFRTLASRTLRASRVAGSKALARGGSDQAGIVPLSTVAFGTLAPALRTQGTGLYNLMRNIGASIGISMMSYLLIRNSAMAQTALVEHITPYREVVHYVSRQFDLATLGGRAAFAQTVTAQAQAIAFVDNLKLMMFVSFLAIPLMILVQRPRRSTGDQGSASDRSNAQ
jgi:DHA2 family multidrug resistance protein